MQNDPLRLTKLASTTGCVSLLVATIGTTDKGIWLPSVFAWFVVAGSGAIGIVGYGLSKRCKLQVKVFYLIVPLLLLGAIGELLFFRDIIGFLTRYLVD